MAKITTLIAAFVFICIFNSFGQDNSDKVSETFKSYITAQNEHDLATLDKLFVQSPDFLMIYANKEHWGTQDAIEAAEVLHKAALVLEPAYDQMKLIMINDQSAQIFVPALYTLKESGRTVKKNMMLNMTLGLKGEEWKIFSILSISTTARK
ncbi:nuclear transport factor 2 family protein [Pollutibacter soli]|uniref:nuclear transport factor 2 family protein n=1 Tax=Pollutibacter soli TaxID=3034157 RepID=UPI0030133189